MVSLFVPIFAIWCTPRKRGTITILWASTATYGPGKRFLEAPWSEPRGSYHIQVTCRKGLVVVHHASCPLKEKRNIWCIASVRVKQYIPCRVKSIRVALSMVKYMLGYFTHDTELINGQVSVLGCILEMLRPSYNLHMQLLFGIIISC
jgi:hypothetical protein